MPDPNSPRLPAAGPAASEYPGRVTGAAGYPWQPIDTAPKDGTDILAWGPFGHGHLVVKFDDRAEPGWPWCTIDGLNYSLTTFTHWMSLPEPPQ